MTTSTPNPEQDDEGAFVEQLDERWLNLVDSALRMQTPLAHTYVERLRAKHPDATRDELMDAAVSRFVNLATVTGAGIGGVAALPGLGTIAAMGLTVGEGLSFAETCAFLTLAAADIHEVDMNDAATRRLVLMAVLSGERGPDIIARSLGKQGVQWNAVLGGGGGFLPSFVTRQISRYVRRRVLARTGGIWLARLLPFGVGAVIGGFGARSVSRDVVEAVQEIFSRSPVIEGERAEDPSALDR